MNEASNTINGWIAAGEPFALIAAGALVAACFVIFNAVRVFLYIPQIATCWKDRQGCPTINLYTWCSWLVANTSTGLYMWMFQADLLGLLLNLGNALMCAATVAITVLKRKQLGFDPRRGGDHPASSDLRRDAADTRHSRTRFARL